MVYLITFDLRKYGKDYDPFFRVIKALGSWISVTESTWLLSGKFPDAPYIFNALRSHIDKDDHLFVAHLVDDNIGWLPDDVVAWLKEQRF